MKHTFNGQKVRFEVTLIFVPLCCSNFGTILIVFWNLEIELLYRFFGFFLSKNNYKLLFRFEKVCDFGGGGGTKKMVT